MKFIKQKEAYTLIEVMVALVIIFVLVFSIYTFLSNSIFMMAESEKMSQADWLTRRMIEQTMGAAENELQISIIEDYLIAEEIEDPEVIDRINGLVNYWDEGNWQNNMTADDSWHGWENFECQLNIKRSWDNDDWTGNNPLEGYDYLLHVEALVEWTERSRTRSTDLSTLVYIE